MDFSWLGSPEFIGASVGLGAIGDIATNVFNYNQQKTAFDYQKTLNERIMEREDTALQRRMEDAKKAGVNPYAVVGQSAGAGGSVSAPNAPQMKSGGTIDAMRTALEAYSTVSEVQKRKQEVLNLEMDNQNKQKEGMILDADLAGKLNTNKILGYDVDNAFLNMQRNLAGFNFDFGRSFYYDSDGKLRDNANEVWKGTNPFRPFGAKLEDTPFYKARNADNNLKYENWLHRNYENATYWDDWSVSHNLKQQEADMYMRNWLFNAGQTAFMNNMNAYAIQGNLGQILQNIRTSKARQKLYEKELAWYDTEKAVDVGSDILDYLTDLIGFTLGK